MKGDLVQIQSIKKKLVLAEKADPSYKVFGASHHAYKLNPPVSRQELEGFEKKHHIQLPQAYRDFVLHIGNGGLSHNGAGAGPFYGIDPLGAGLGHFTEGQGGAFLTQKCLIPAKR